MRALWLFAVWSSLAIGADKTATDPYGRKVVAGELLIKMRGDLILPQSTGSRFAPLLRTHKEAKGRIKRRFSTLPRLALVELEHEQSLEEAIAAYKRSGLLEAVSYNYIRKASVLPNDALLQDGKQWGMNNSGQLGGIVGADVSASEAWDVVSEAPDVVVAILDSGIRYTHEDLAANMWVNSGEVAGNGLDDDGNGFIDDVHGINTVGANGDRTPETEGDPMDDLGHGTHVAGIVGAVGNNGVGVTGVAWNVKLMALKFLDSEGEGSDADAIECINYAREQGARIINSSWGGLDFNPLLGDAIEQANEAGIYFIASAGNGSSNNDDQPNYPSSYAYPNVVSVTATDKRDGFASFANYGESEVELAAPGVGINSTYFNSDSDYRALSGTSMATPFVSGAIALLVTRFPDESMSTILNRLYSSTDTLEGLARRCRVGGRLNISRALELEMPKPLNDDFSNATLVQNSPLVVSGFNSTATLEASEGPHDPEGTGRSVWWSWTADTDGFAELSSTGSDFNTMVAVYQGETLDALQLVAKDRDVSPGHNGALLGFNAEAGQIYRIAVDGLLGATGNISLSLGQTVVNDDFANALEIEGINVKTSSENIAATRESGEPDHVANTFGSKSVWWSWKAPLSGNVTISTSASNSFDTLLAVYTGGRLDELQLIASNDDDDRTGVWTSALTLYAQEGETYKIAVDGWNGGFGEIGLTVAMAESDDLEDARNVVSDTFEDVSFTNQATKESGEPNHGGSASGQSLWWRWKATRSGHAEIATFGSDFDTVLAVYDGQSIGALNVLVENDDSGGALSSRVAFDVEVGEVYYIAVDGNDFRADRSYGLARLTISVEEDPSWLTPVIADPGTFEAIAGDTIDFTIAATRNPTLFAANGLPAGLSLDESTGVFSGTPLQSGRFEVLIEATNEAGIGLYLHVLDIEPRPGAPIASPMPIEKKAVEGTRMELSIQVEDETDISYQWFKDGSALLGFDSSSLLIESMNSVAEGSYSVEVANSNGTILVGSTRVRMIREALVNISTRGYVGLDAEVMIAGFIITGSQPRQVLIRGLGKSMESPESNIEAVLADPKLTLRDWKGQLIVSQDNWLEEPNWATVESVGLSVGAAPPVDSGESAILTTLDPGLYTVALSGADGGTGLGLIEVFDASSESIETRLANISTRVRASIGQEVAIAGFVITGQDPKRVLIRALGPDLLKRNVPGVLPDPRMILYQGQDVIATNDDWEDQNGFLITEASRQVNTSILDEGSKDAAMVCELRPGLYTVIVNDFADDSGIALVEVHELP